MSELPAKNGIPDLDLLEDRVRRLEDVVAGLQDTRPLEDRVVERLTARTAAPVTVLPAPEPRDGPRPTATQLIIEAGRHLLPSTREGEPAAESKEERHEERRAEPAPDRTRWLPFDLYADARATLRMYLDPRYRMSWWGRVLPPVLLAMIVTSWFWVPFATLLYSITNTGGAILIKAVDLLLAYVLFKVLQPEVRRYRQTSPDLPAALRL